MIVNLAEWTTELQLSMASVARYWNCCGGRGQPAGCAGQQRSETQALLDYLLGGVNGTRDGIGECWRYKMSTCSTVLQKTVGVAVVSTFPRILCTPKIQTFP